VRATTTVEATPATSLDTTASTALPDDQEIEVDEGSPRTSEGRAPEVLSGSVSPQPTGDPDPDATTGSDRDDEDLPVAFDDSDDGLFQGPAAIAVTWLGVMSGVVVVILVIDELRRRRSR
jgi:hypothetical protein